MARQQGGNGQKSNQGNGRHEQMRENEVMSAEGRIRDVLRELDARGDELRPILPRDIPFEGFLANVNTALRNNPKLLRCTFDSLVNACVKAAYDGLRIDGREAAIVDAEERYNDGGVWKSRAVARYMPMVFGLIKQILDCGAALAVKAVIVYSHEEQTGRFKLLEGTVQEIHHEPILTGEKGEMIGAYALATIAPGVFKYEWMDKPAILDVKAESKTDKVWTRWPTEMWKKTVIRRLRKSLNGTSRIIDMEAREIFPHFDSSQPHPQLASAPPRPTRGAPLLEQDRSQPFNDFSGNQQDDRERVIDNRQQEQERQQDRRAAASQEDVQRSDPKREQAQIPADDAEWGVWGVEIESLIDRSQSTKELADLQKRNAATLREASKPVRDRISQKFTDRAADIAAGPDGGAAAGEAGDNSSAAGEK